MSLLKWKEIAKSKSKLGDKINYVHNEITKHKIGQETSQDSFEKVFKPVTTKLDDVITSNLRMPQKGKRLTKKGEVPNYGIDIDDEVEDMNLGDLFDEQPVLPESEKQLVPKPPTYEESLEDILEGKEIYVDPQYFPQDPQEMFFNDVNQLLKKLELIIGEVLAGNTSIKMRNTGVAILDTLLRMSTINRPQYNKLYNKYFKV